MLPYWLLLLIPLFLCIQSPRYVWPAWQASLICIFLSLFIGLRHEIGGDWFNYLPYLTRAEDISLSEAIILWGDPGYNLLNWLFASHTWGIYGVNLLSGAIFSVGLVWFCRCQPRPWLALLVSIPYLVIVVAMGYSRQGVAIGIMMPGLLALEQGRLRAFLLSIAFAATFHSTALVMLAFVVPAIPGRTLFLRSMRFLVLSIVSLVLVQTFLTSRYDQLVAGYVDAEYTSQGAAIRVAISLLPACIILLWSKRFALTYQQLRLWRSIAYVALACALALLLFPSNTTAVDRIALYVIPLQIVVASHLPSTQILGLTPIQLLLVVVFLYVSVQYVWLNHAIHANAWLPYSNLIFQ